MQFVFNGGDSCVCVSGEFTFSDHPIFLDISKRLFATKAPTIIIDLSKLDFIDSAGLGMLLIARDEAASTQRSLILRCPQGQVKRMFNVTKFDTLFNVEV